MFAMFSSSHFYIPGYGPADIILNMQTDTESGKMKAKQVVKSADHNSLSIV